MIKESESSLWDDLDWEELDESVAPLSTPESILENKAADRSQDTPTPASPPQEPAIQALSDNNRDRQTPSATPQPIPPPTQTSSQDKPRQVFVPNSIGRLSMVHDLGDTVQVDIVDHLPIGRNSANGLVIKDRRVSGYHAKILPTAEGLFEIVDLKSTGGTFVNGASIARHTLSDGDRIEFATLPAVFNYLAGALCDPMIDEGATLFTPIQSKKPQAGPTFHQPVFALTIKEEGAAPRRVPLSRNVAIGRNQQSQIILKDARVSGRHAWILLWEDGWVELLDLYSTWGTKLNDQPVLNAFLKPSDVINIGPVEVLFDHWQS